MPLHNMEGSDEEEDDEEDEEDDIVDKEAAFTVSDSMGGGHTYSQHNYYMLLQLCT